MIKAYYLLLVLPEKNRTTSAALRTKINNKNEQTEAQAQRWGGRHLGLLISSPGGWQARPVGGGALTGRGHRAGAGEQPLDSAALG